MDKTTSFVPDASAFINGSWHRVDHEQCFDVLDPATLNVISRVPDLTEQECIAAVDAAVKVSSKLAAMTGKERGRLLRKWYGLIEESKEQLASIITSENGKPLDEARGEIAYTNDFVDWFSCEAPKISGSTIQASKASNRIVTVKQPVGVVGIVTPWNFPAAMIARKVAAALAAGCPCVVKPAPETPLTALALASLAHAAGFPPGSLNIVTTKANTVGVGKVLTQHPQIRKFSFTGSTAVGKLLAAQCTTTVKRVSLELGGNAPFVVFDDADLERASEAIMASKFRLSGQTCICANRVYVQSGIYNELAGILVGKVKQFRLGPGKDANTTLGPLITPGAVDKVEAHVKDAVSRGARTLVGGRRSASGLCFFEPTVLADVPFDSLCAAEETFGPLLPLMRFESEEEVVRAANKSEAGLAGYLFTCDTSRSWRMAEALEVGMVGVNTGIISDVASPFGGVKASGQGREGSFLGIEEFLEVKSITFGV